MNEFTHIQTCVPLIHKNVVFHITYTSSPISSPIFILLINVYDHFKSQFTSIMDEIKKLGPELRALHRLTMLYFALCTA